MSKVFRDHKICSYCKRIFTARDPAPMVLPIDIYFKLSQVLAAGRKWGSCGVCFHDLDMMINLEKEAEELLG